MAQSSKTLYNPADHATSNALLPEEVFGHIDVATLTNIHLYLRESELQDDIELATWVQENYLQAVEKDQPTAMIRTAQGFAQLDRAFRRVRSLTNKAQDKWPFFDRNFKQMSSATVRNNARGEAAPGVMYPIDATQRALSAVKQSLTPSAPNVSPTPRLQVPFSSTMSSRSQSHIHEYPRPARRTPVPLPSNLLATSPQNDSKKDPTLPEESTLELQARADNTSEADGHTTHSAHPSRAALLNNSTRGAGTEASPGGTDTSEVKSPSADGPQGLFSNTDDLETEPMRDAGGGKVRGPNGRYLPKEDVLSIPKPIKKPTGKGRKLSVKPTDQGEPDASEEAPEKPQSVSDEDENVSVAVSTPPTSNFDQEVEKHDADDATVVLPASDTGLPLAAGHEAHDQSPPLTEPTTAYLLAAEADAVPSNLDRLPPNSRKTLKRKSEPILQSSERKRGKYGGIVGRPRKSEQRETKNTIEAENSPQKEAEPVESLPQMTTRRSTRRSAAANLGTPEPAEPAARTQKKTPKSLKKQVSPQGPVGNSQGGTNEQEMMGNAEADSSQPSSAIPVAATKARDRDLMEFALGKTSSAVSRAQPGAYQSPYQPLTQPLPAAPQNAEPDVHIANGVEQKHPPGHFELLARLTTGKGTLEIPISTDLINSDEAKIIKKYAEWNAKPHAVHIPYDQFRQLFSFVKKD